jgi:hypothetical protein
MDETYGFKESYQDDKVIFDAWLEKDAPKIIQGICDAFPGERSKL